MSVKMQSALVPPAMTAAQRDAIPAGRRPPGATIFDTTSGQLETNIGSDAAPVWLPLAVPLVTSLLSSPIDGQEVYFLADAAKGLVWHLRYRAASGSAYKWEAIGPVPSMAGPAGSSTITTTAAVEMTSGPRVTFPLAGEYEVLFGTWLQDNGTPSPVRTLTGFLWNVVGGGSAGYPAAQFVPTASWSGANVSVRVLVTVTAGSVYGIGINQNVASAQGMNGSNAWLAVTPVRVG
jgi:hypothetical protein